MTDIIKGKQGSLVHHRKGASSGRGVGANPRAGGDSALERGGNSMHSSVLEPLPKVQSLLETSAFKD